jgi:hypothetical protein
MKVVVGINEMELYLLGLCVLSSTAYALGVPKPGSLEEQLPDWVPVFWYVNLLIGSLLVLYGGLWPRKPTDQSLMRGLGLYRAGWLYVGASCTFYGLFVLASFKDGALFAGGLVLALGLGSYHRSHRVQKIIKHTQEEVQRAASTPGTDEGSGTRN